MSSASTEGSFWDRSRSYVYDKVIVGFTYKWYKQVLDRIPENSHILDVGIGTGTALVANAPTLLAKNITVLGVDYDASYVQKCRAHIAEADLMRYITVVQADIHEFSPPDSRLFHHIYFSGSFMILPRQADVLKKLTSFLLDREDGRFFFTQTFELQKNALMEWLKPKLHNVTSIDFGNVSYEADFDDILHEADVVIESVNVLDDGKKVEGVRESRLICARSNIYVSKEAESSI